MRRLRIEIGKFMAGGRPLKENERDREPLNNYTCLEVTINAMYGRKTETSSNL